MGKENNLELQYRGGDIGNKKPASAIQLKRVFYIYASIELLSLQKEAFNLLHGSRCEIQV